ncbi:hypothetical protein NGF19_12830 [Streptomyces sp. RY43-2]|uniref:Transcription regulator HTH AraC- type ligand binding domain-containing protein n=1 Tax=Streptomyces macrolidinus TaxID=2952607 RepID=A0ABT0ZDK2_9ACTN|nr:hypothetical protein [Streptomyces macrolidinus]
MPNDVAHEEPETGIHARMELWRVGGLDLFAPRNSGFEVRRTARHVRHHRSPPVVSVSLQPMGVHRAEVSGRQEFLGSDDICVFHELSPRVYGWSGDGASQSMMFDMHRLGVPVDVVVRASLQLRSSPPYDLVLRHLRGGVARSRSPEGGSRRGGSGVRHDGARTRSASLGRARRTDH